MARVEDTEAMVEVPLGEEENFYGLSREARVPGSSPAWQGMAVRAAAAMGLVAVGFLLGTAHTQKESITLPGLIEGTPTSKAKLPDIIGKNELEVTKDFPDQLREVLHPFAQQRELLPGRVQDNSFGPVAQVDCSIDVAQTVFRLMEAANAIVQAVDFDCKKHGGLIGLATFGDKGNEWSNDDRLRCSSSILTAIYSFTITATMIASAVSDCVPGHDPSAQCTAAITSFSGNMLVAVQSGIGSDLACAPYKGDKTEWAIRWGADPTGNWDEEKHPFLHNVNKLNNKLKLPANPIENFTNPINGRAVPRCIAFVGLGSTFLMRMATGITASVTQCDQETIKTTASGQRLCAVDMMGLIGSISLATSFLSGAVDACDLIEGEGFRDAGCAASIAGIVGGLSAALAADGQLIGTCSRAELADTSA